jgi:hypothetical protein
VLQQQFPVFLQCNRIRSTQAVFKGCQVEFFALIFECLSGSLRAILPQFDAKKLLWLGGIESESTRGGVGCAGEIPTLPRDITLLRPGTGALHFETGKGTLLPFLALIGALTYHATTSGLHHLEESLGIKLFQSIAGQEPIVVRQMM